MLTSSRLKRQKIGAIAAILILVAAIVVPGRAHAVTTLDYDPKNTINPVADNITRLNVNKLQKDSHEHVVGAHMAIIEKETGEIVAEWTTDGSVHEVARNTDDPKHGALNVDTVYILRELEAPEGYTKAADTEFVIHSDNFNTTGEIIEGPDAESEEIRGSGPEQAFVINLYDDLSINAEEEEQKVTRRTDTEVETEVHVSNERTETRTTTNNSSYGDSQTITNSNSITTRNSLSNTESTTSTRSDSNVNTTNQSVTTATTMSTSNANSNTSSSNSSRTSNERLTQTGDDTSNAPAIVLAVLAAGIFVAAVVLKRKK